MSVILECAPRRVWPLMGVSYTVRGVCRVSRWPQMVPSLEDMPQEMRSE